jgi:hypothetical protein
MAARPPPARPHISGVNPSHLSFSIAEWGEDDAWDSASDDDAPQKSSWRPPTSADKPSAPKPVPPRPRLAHDSASDASSVLAFSYTDVTAPSPSSYPPAPTPDADPSSAAHDRAAALARNDWTLLVKAHDAPSAVRRPLAPHTSGEREGVGEEMVLGDLEPDVDTDPDGEGDFLDMPIVKTRPDVGKLKPDADAIVHGVPPPLSYPAARVGTQTAARAQTP